MNPNSDAHDYETRNQPKVVPNVARGLLRKLAGLGTAALGALCISGCASPSASGQRSTVNRATLPPGDTSKGADNFYRSDRVTVQKVTFTNQYKMNVAGTLFVPNSLNRGTRNPAIVVGHPMGAVKEQSANLYATKLAEQGFATLSFDLSFWGDSQGQPRNAVSTDIYSEDFSAAVDFLSTQPFVDSARIGALGICAGGAFVISAAKTDVRMKAIATVSMVDMGAVTRQLMTPAQQTQMLEESARQRVVEFGGGEPKYTGGTPETLDATSTPLDREFYDFYRTRRGAANTTTRPTLTSYVKFLNFYPLNDIARISPRPMLFIAGEVAISKGVSEEAYRLAAEPKQLVVVPGAGHVDLCDRVNLIPIDKLTSFFRDNLR